MSNHCYSYSDVEQILSGTELEETTETVFISHDNYRVLFQNFRAPQHSSFSLEFSFEPTPQDIEFVLNSYIEDYKTEGDFMKFTKFNIAAIAVRHVQGPADYPLNIWEPVGKIYPAGAEGEAVQCRIFGMKVNVWSKG